MSNKFDVTRREHNLSDRSTRSLKEFMDEIPGHAAYRVEEREDGFFLMFFWINVNDIEPDEDEEIPSAYVINLPQSAVYGKIAHQMITSLKAIDGMPFILDATNTIELSKGFIDILLRNIKDYQAPCVIAKGWVREQMAILDEVSTKYRVVVRKYEDEIVR